MSIPYSFQRSIIIEKTPRQVYQIVRDLQQNEVWSPWYVVDPEVQVALTKGDGKKLGSIQAWESSVMGTGEQEITALQADKMVSHDLRFFTPWKAEAKSKMTLRKVKKGTKVIWEFEGNMPVFLFFMVKKITAMVAADFDRGLAMLKDYAETGKVLSKIKVLGVQEMEGCMYVGKMVSGETKNVKKILGPEFMKLGKWSAEASIKTGIWFTICHKWDFVTGTFKSTVGAAVSEKPKNAPDGFKFKKLSAGKALVIEHKGSYDHLANGWAAAMMHQQSLRLKKGKGDPLEVYLNDPQKVKPDNVRTGIYIPVK